jgi:hypothetical protein
MSNRIKYLLLVTVAACAGTKGGELAEENVGESESALSAPPCDEKGCPPVSKPPPFPPPPPPTFPPPPPPPPKDGGGGGMSDGGGGGYDSGVVDAGPPKDGGITDGGPPKDSGVTDSGTDGGGTDGGTDGGAGGLELRKSFAVTDQTILTNFTFQRVMNQLTTQGATPTTSLGLYQQWWDTQHRAAQGTTTGPHCDDQTAFGVPSHNGFPWQCPRNEGDMATTDPFNAAGGAFVFPIGVFNRFDLAPANGANCGEHRIVFGNTRSRNLIIFEAVLPNPTPSCGIDSCRPVADFWAGLSNPSLTANDVRTRLEQFYFTGLPGFEPVVHINHYGAVGGQIRSNQFQSGSAGSQLWMLREFKLGKICNAAGACVVRILPTTVKTNPGAQLFSDASGHPQQGAFQAEFTGSMVSTLAQNDINAFGMSVPDTFNSGQSHSQSFDTNPTSPTITNDYNGLFAPSGQLANAIQGRLNQIQSPLSPTQIVARATTQSCGGCHQFSNNRALGGNLTWPSSLGFVHVSEQGSEPGAFGTAFPISPALKDVFLPHRRVVMQSFLQRPIVACGPPPGSPPPVKPALVTTKAALESAPPTGETIGGTRSVH